MDRIDYNVQSVSVSVEEGLKQLEKVCSRYLLHIHQMQTRVENLKLSLQTYCSYSSLFVGN